MKIVLSPNAEVLGLKAAEETAEIIRDAIAKDGTARIVLSTGASQFTTLAALTVMEDINWKKVEMFHLDEYMNLPATHPASFRKYLKERFVDKTGIEKVHFVDGTREGMATLGEMLNAAPIHVGLIGIGQNAHIAFNDPPADFDTEEAYIVVKLNDACRHQQVHEGWFATEDDVPTYAVSMSVKQIMRCQRIISAVPYTEKAYAVQHTLEDELSPAVPATMLKEHPAFSLYVDQDSFGQVDIKKVKPSPRQPGCVLTIV